MGKKLYVGNLEYGVTSSDLEQWFGDHGTVTSAQVIEDRDTGRSKGFGFVEMSSDSEAQAAIQAMNGQAKNNRTLFEPQPGIQDRWAIINGDKDPYCKVPTQQAFAAQVPGAVVHGVKGLSHGFGSGDWLTPFLREHRIMSGQEAAP